MSELLSIDDLSYKLPITNSIFISVFLSFSLPFFLSPNQVNSYLVCKSDLSILIPSPDWFKFLISRIVFLDFKNYFFALILITIFRNFERIYGSKKFLNYLFANFVISTLFEITIINLLNYFNILNIDQLANGCYSLIFVLFINYCKDIPKEKFDFFGLNFSEKLLFYLFGVQMFFTSYSILISCLSGLISGIICRSNAFNACDYLRLPQSFNFYLIKALNLILLSNKPKESVLNGATADFRRQQYIELYEQNLLNDQINLINQQQQNQSDNATSSGISSNVSSSSSNQSLPVLNEAELEQNVNKLAEMGFTKEQAASSLTRCANDLRRATNLLLEDQ